MVSSAERTATAAPAVGLGAADALPGPSGGFWLPAALAAVLAEAGADELGRRFGPATALAAGLALAVVAVGTQLRLRRHVPVVFWAAVAATGLATTTAVDAAHAGLGVTHQVLTASLAAAVAATLAVAHRLGRHPAGFWAVLVGVLALGTALGDWATASLDLGFLGSAVLWALVAALPAVAHGVGLDATAAFWCALLAVRPFGASLADWLAVPVPHGGLGWGDAAVAWAGGGLLALAAAVLTLRRSAAPPA